jgi:hypothetical protein
MVFNATSTIFQQYCRGQFYLMQETRVSGENHRPVASHCQSLIIYLYQIYILVTIYFTKSFSIHIPVIQTRDKNQDLVSQTLHQDQEAVQTVSLSQIVDLITITIMTMLEGIKMLVVSCFYHLSLFVLCFLHNTESQIYLF